MANPTPARGPIRSTFADDPDMRPLVEEFVAEMEQRVQELSACWDHSRGEDLKRISHQLKGASAGYGFDGLGEAAARLEQSLKRMGDLSGDLSSLRDEFEGLIDLCRRASA